MIRRIDLYLIDGTMDGLIRCNQYGLSEVAFKFNRSQLVNKTVNRQQEFSHGGIYFLIGTDELGSPSVYVGQGSARKNGDGIFSRIQAHVKSEDKNFFQEVIILTSMQDWFGSTELNYLEHTFMNRIKNANRYKVKNLNDPNPGNVSIHQQSVLEGVVRQGELLMEVLGYPLCKELTEIESPQSLEMISLKDENRIETILSSIPSRKQEDLLYINRYSMRHKYQLQAVCKEENGVYTVLAGSRVSTRGLPSLGPTLDAVYKEYMESGILTKEGILLKDCEFKSSSGAAKFVIGTSVSGNEVWLDKNGKSLKEKTTAYEKKQDVSLSSRTNIEAIVLRIVRKNYKKSGKHIDATCIFSNGTYTVCKGSKIRTDETKSFREKKHTEYERRREFFTKGLVKDSILMEDVTFTSASGASNFVLGISSNGRIEWQTEDGQLLGHILTD